MVAVPGGSVAYMLGAVTGIESKAVIDGTSLSGAMSQDRFALRSVHQGARRGQGANRRATARGTIRFPYFCAIGVDQQSPRLGVEFSGLDGGRTLAKCARPNLIINETVVRNPIKMVPRRLGSVTLLGANPQTVFRTLI